MSLNWEYLNLGDFAQVISGFAFKSKDFKSGGVPVIKIKNIRVGKVDMSDASYVDPSFLDRVDKKYHVKNGDILISLTGSHLTLPNSVVGRVAPYSSKLGTSLLNQRAGKILVTRPDRVTSPFLLYTLYTEEIRKSIALMAHGSASQANVSPGQIESLKVFLPPLPTQRKIAAILSAYDDLIENNNRRIEILEEMARMLYREWFVKFRYPGHESDRFYESELGLIPEGWEVVKLSSLVKTQYGYTESACEEAIGPKYVRGKDINKTSYIQWDLVPYCPISEDNYEKYKLKTRDILVIRMADPGKVGIVEQEVDAVFASYLIRLSINEDSNLKPYYLFYFLNSDNYQDYITGASTGTTRKSASAGVLTDVSIVLPPRAVQKRFEDNVLNFRKMINSLLKKNNNLRQTRDLLLPRLISGEIDVENLDIKVIDN